MKTPNEGTVESRRPADGAPPESLSEEELAYRKTMPLDGRYRQEIVACTAEADDLRYGAPTMLPLPIPPTRP